MGGPRSGAGNSHGNVHIRESLLVTFAGCVSLNSLIAEGDAWLFKRETEYGGMMDLVALGTGIKQLILAIAKGVTQEHLPGLISLGLLLACAFVAAAMFWTTMSRARLLRLLRRRIEATEDSSTFQSRIGDIESDLLRRRRGAGKRLARAFSEFRETLLEPARNGESNIRNAFRPGAFLNLEELHFGLSGGVSGRGCSCQPGCC